MLKLKNYIETVQERPHTDMPFLFINLFYFFFKCMHWLCAFSTVCFYLSVNGYNALELGASYSFLLTVYSQFYIVMMSPSWCFGVWIEYILLCLPYMEISKTFIIPGKCL